MKKRFGMLLALVLVVLMGMTAVAMAGEKCPDGQCAFLEGNDHCGICRYTRDGVYHELTADPNFGLLHGWEGDEHHGLLWCPTCKVSVHVIIEMDSEWHDGTACKECGSMSLGNGGHTWNAETRECAKCGVLPQKCPGHVYNKKYYDPDTGKPVCDLCHNTGVAFDDYGHNWLFGSDQIPTVDGYVDEDVHQVHLMCNTWYAVVDGEIKGKVGDLTYYDYNAICWDEPHNMIALAGHKVPVCYGNMLDGNVDWSYGCMADEYGITHYENEDGTCAVCCPNENCSDGVLMDGPLGKICNKCSQDAAGNEHKITSTTYAYKDASNHTRTEVCSCGDTIPGNEPHRYNQTGHEAPYCVCGADASGKLHSGTSAECEACDKIREENACKHRVLTGKYYTWLSAERHLMVATCKECEETIRGNEPHSYNKNWHNGTVCQYCQTDENEVKHDWLNGACTACGEGKPEPAPIPDGLNPDDGWYYVDGKKSSFTGLAEYDGGLFYIEDGEWQKELNGLKLIGEDFWFLAGGQVQEHHGFALYDGEWFYLDGGKLDVTASGVYSYDGKSFLVAAGRLVSECTGLAQVPSGEWYYVAEGRVLTEFSGEVEYDGKLFQIVNGKLVA